MRAVFLSILVSLFSAAGALAAPIQAIDSYYTFGANVSSNSGTRLLADKAADIGFPFLQSISFLQFDAGDLPSATLAANEIAVLSLQHDPSLAPTLIPASNARPVSLSVYGATGTWDPVNGNLADIQYGLNGASAFAKTFVGDAGIYKWDITQLINDFISAGTSTSQTFLALSGLFGNTDIDGRNSYGIFHAPGSNTGLGPQISIEVIPLPLPAVLLITGIIGLAGMRRYL